MEKMTCLERFRATLAREKVDRVCVQTFSTALIMSRYSGLNVEDIRWNPKKAVEVGKKYMDFVGDDFYYNLDLMSPFKDCGIPLKEPATNHCSPKINYFENDEDIDSKDIPIDIMNPKETPWMNKGMFEKVELARESWGDKYLILGCSWGIFTTAGLLRGTEKLMMDLFVNEDLSFKLLKKSAKLVKDVQARFCEAGAHNIFNGDPSGSEDLISADTFKKYAFKPTKEIVDHLKSKYDFEAYGLHICGDTSNTCMLAPEMNIDYYSFDSHVPLAHYKEAIGDRIAILGNIPTVTTTMQGTVNNVMKAAEDCIKTGVVGGGYILGGACDAPMESPIENVRAFVKAAEKYTPLYQ